MCVHNTQFIILILHLTGGKAAQPAPPLASKKESVRDGLP